MHPLKPSLRTPYKHISTTPIPTDIYLPPPSPSHPPACPVLLMIHGGAFMLGHAGMNNKDQIQDALDRGWIVLALEHRLCPGVNVLEGPITDVRDALAWVYNGGLSNALVGQEWEGSVDEERVVVMGTSSGGHLALCTAFNTPRTPLAILDFYGAKNFSDPFWTQPLPSLPASFSTPLPPSTIQTIESEHTILIGGVSLEGQTTSTSTYLEQNPHPRKTYTMHALKTGTLLPRIYPLFPSHIADIDPALNLSAQWPPIGIVHGTADVMIPLRLSTAFAQELGAVGGDVRVWEVQGEGHTFCGGMKRGGETWRVQRRGWEWLEGVVKGSYGGGV
ncbi:alpha/beta-hydrolase [Plenodomus tracheiphilus IPT5]|uniref:Alpha/beta-hydrolase n=1 Tax=Plenodomus tracheiphilus IPT5 TaxID=1408161 RepID=A0A6A7B339_9PLEO|nr:alpha/beta-hydrolase [Plenodomus tracheiphilus IPT5]